MKAGYGDLFSVTVAVSVTVRISGVVSAGEGLTTEKIAVSEGPGCLSGLAVMVPITAVEVTVRTEKYIPGGDLGRFLTLS